MNRNFRSVIVLSLVSASQIALCQTWQYTYRANAVAAYAVKNGSLLISAVNAGPLVLHKDRSASASVTSATYMDVVAVDAASAQTTSSLGTVTSTSSVSGLLVRLPTMPAGQYLVTADLIESQTEGVAGVLAQGSVNIQGLTILGVPVVPNGRANQRISFDVLGYGTVKVFLNAKQYSADGVTLTTSAIRVVLQDGTNVYLARTTAGVVAL